jgi:hypothetical protein
MHDPAISESANKFLASMTMTFDMWHDGTGYDLDILKSLPDSEKEAIERILIDHHPRDWRDIEALGVIDSARAKQEIEAALKSSDPEVRREAQRQLPQQTNPDDRERLLVQSLKRDSLFAGLGNAIDEAAEFHPPAVVDALFQGALNHDGESAVNFAALLFYIHGKAGEPFDWNQRPFFLRFNTSNREDRKTAFKEMCEKLSVDSGKYLR